MQMNEPIDPHREPLHRYALGVFIDSFARSVHDLPESHRKRVLEDFQKHCAWHLSHPKTEGVHKTYVDALRRSLRANLDYLAKRR